MDSTDITDDLHAIHEALEAWPEPTITGSQLYTLIRSAAPKLDIRALVNIPQGSGALTAFIGRHLSGAIERIGNKGGDVLHHIKGRDLTASPSSVSPQIWRTFVSPNSAQQLVLKPSTGLLLAREAPASTAEGEMAVAEASPPEHDRIRAEFVSSLPQPVADALNERTGSDPAFETWVAALREHLPDTFRQWGLFRRQRLAELFAARIRGLELGDVLEPIVLEQIRAAERAAYDGRKGVRAASVKAGGRREQGEGEADAMRRARRLAHAALDQLSYEELRALKMPLGAMLDAMRSAA